MRVTVDREVCMSHGQCEFAAPAVFSLDDDGVVRHAEQVDPADEASVAEAVAVCPTQAISVSA